MLREQVAEHYRDRGYRVQERLRAEGASGQVHVLDLVASNHLGRLAVFFGDAGGIDVAELAALQRTARDVGANPVVAVPRISGPLRAAAGQRGIVLLEASQLGDAAHPAPVDPERPRSAWPEAGKARPWPSRDAPRLSDAMLDRQRHDDAPEAPFAWLGGSGKGEQERFDWLRDKPRPAAKPVVKPATTPRTAPPAAPKAPEPAPEPAPQPAPAPEPVPARRRSAVDEVNWRVDRDVVDAALQGRPRAAAVSTSAAPAPKAREPEPAAPVPRATPKEPTVANPLGRLLVFAAVYGVVTAFVLFLLFVLVWG